MSTNIREHLVKVVEQFHTIEVALFNTFNFNADFFEQNVLPALFGVDPADTRSSREQAVHRSLLETSVGVFCDPSQLRPSRKPYRYTVYPVFVEGRLFHPKNIILIGTDDHGTRWVYIASMSANLSLNAWGKNCEGFADTWVHSRTEDAGKALAEFLDWLHERVGSGTADDALQQARDLLTQLKPRVSKSDPFGGDYNDKRKVGLYFSPQQKSMWGYVKERYGAIQKVRAASPYWGNANSTANALQGVPIELIAARIPPLHANVLLGQDLIDSLAAANCRPKVGTWVKDEGRFYHAKLYDIQTRDGRVTGVGSCNFTRPGLFWDRGEENLPGNVECMLFDVTRMSWPPTQALTADELPPTSSDDDAPQPWSFYVFVQYDWRTERFEWRLQGESGADIELQLIGQAPIRVNDAHPNGQRKGTLKSRAFRLLSNGQQWDGIVTEVNLSDSTQEYSKPLSTDTIIESWHSGAVTEPPAEGDDDGDNTDGDDPDAKRLPGNSDAAPAMFDSFRFFQAFKILRGKVLESAADRKQLLAWLVGRSDSVQAFVNAISASQYQSAAKLVMCVECDALMRLLPPHREASAVRKKLRNELAQSRREVNLEITEELHRRGLPPNATQMLDWYIKRLTNPRRTQNNQLTVSEV
jgi:hypothetical protein